MLAPLYLPPRRDGARHRVGAKDHTPELTEANIHKTKSSIPGRILSGKYTVAIAKQRHVNQTNRTKHKRRNIHVSETGGRCTCLLVGAARVPETREDPAIKGGISAITQTSLDLVKLLGLVTWFRNRSGLVQLLGLEIVLDLVTLETGWPL